MTTSRPKATGNSEKSPMGEETSGFATVLTLAASGVKTINELADSYSTFIAAADRRRTVEIDNAIKMEKAKADDVKEANRHREQMIKLEQELRKHSDSMADREVVRSITIEMVEGFRIEYQRYLSLDQDAFLGESTGKRLESLRRDIVGLAKSLSKPV